MEAEVTRFAGAGRPPATGGCAAGWSSCTGRRCGRFIDTNFDSPFQLLTPDLARLAALGGFGRLDARIGRFLRDERLRRVFSFQALYAGVPPARALAAYAVIAYMDTVAGVYFPRGGMHAAARGPWRTPPTTAGADLRYGQEVIRLERSGDRVTAVRHRDGSASPATPSSSPATCPSPTGCSAARPRRPLPLQALAVGGRPARRHRPDLARARATTPCPSAPPGGAPSTNSPAPAA